MSQLCNYGCSALPDHQQVVCNQYSPGGISSVALVECDQTTITDFSNGTQWTAAIANGSAKIIRDIKGEIPAASPIMVDNPVACGSDQILSGMTNTATWTDANINGNNDSLYASLNLRKYYLVVFMCKAEEIRVSSEPVDFQALPVTVPNNDTTWQMYTGTATFKTNVGDIPFVLYDAPSGIFN